MGCPFLNTLAHFWSILGQITIPVLSEPFIIGIFSGDKRRDNIYAYLENFIAEMKFLQENGLLRSQSHVSYLMPLPEHILSTLKTIMDFMGVISASKGG